MVIDIFTHVLPRPVLDRLARIPNGFGAMGSRIQNFTPLYEFDARFRAMDEFADYGQVISLSSPSLEEVTDPKTGAALARIANDAMAELVRRHPARFPAFVASLALHNMEASMSELARAIDQLGAAGVQLFTDVAGKPIDAPEFRPVFAEMARRGRPIWMHPTRGPEMADFQAESESLYDVWQTLGWPYATSAAMLRLVLTGLFDRHPGLNLITHHLGGMIPYHTVRIGNMLTRELAKRPEAAGGAPVRPALDYLRMFYGDTAMHGAVAPVRCGLDFFGADHVVFATDSPFGSVKAGFNMLNAIGVDAETRRKIEAGNAERLMGRA